MFLLRILFVVIISINFAYADVIIRDSEIEGVIKDIAAPILKSAEIDPNSVRFFIVDSDDLNAYVAGGQNIFLTTGLLRFSEDPDTLVGVIAHETGHIVGGHLFFSKDEQKLASAKTIVGLLIGAAAGVATKSTDVGLGTAMGMSQAGVMGFLKFSRQQESSADHAAIKFLNANNISGAGLVRFLSHLHSTEKAFYGEQNTYFRTHPVSSERIEYLRNNIKYDANKPNFLGHDLRARFSTSMKKLVAFTLIKSRLFELTSKDPYQSAIANFRLARFENALNEVAALITKEPSNPYYYELKGQIYFDKGDMDNAKIAYQKASSLRPHDDLLKINVAQVQVTQGKDLASAVSTLNSMILKESDNIAAWQYLAIAYGKQGKIANQNLCLGWTALYTGDVAQAKRMVALTKQVLDSLDQPLKQKLNDLELIIKDVEKNMQG